MSESKQILKEQFVEHFLFDYTDKDEFEVQMLSEIFEGIYYQKDKHFKPESKYWQVFRCLESQQAKIDDLQKRVDEALFEMRQLSLMLSKDIDGYEDPAQICQSEGVDMGVRILEKALRGERE